MAFSRSALLLETTVKQLGAFNGILAERCRALLDRFGLTLQIVADGSSIPGSYWGASEAGLISDRIYARQDTPLHSLLHEASHYICMDSFRRERLHTDAGGTYAEEDAVCYLQILLSDYLKGYDSEQSMRDMDTWGYTFRLGSSRSWFLEDSEEARQWLLDHGIIDSQQNITWRCNQSP
jgi:hypothetical protein